MSYKCNNCGKNFSSKREKRRSDNEKCPWCGSTDLVLKAELGWSKKGMAS